MNVYSALTAFLCPHPVAGLLAAKQPARLLPRTAADEMPPYREEPPMLEGRRRRELDPSWTLAPMGRW